MLIRKPAAASGRQRRLARRAASVHSRRARDAADGRSKPAAMRSSEVLPDPLRLEHDAASPCATGRVIPCSATAPVALSADDVAELECERPLIRPTAPSTPRPAEPRR
jgi:hypothetical protein